MGKSINGDPNWKVIISTAVGILLFGLLVGSGSVYVYYHSEGYRNTINTTVDTTIYTTDLTPIGEGDAYILNGTLPPYGARASEVLPSLGGVPNVVATFIVMDAQGYLHLVAARVPKDVNGQPSFDDPRLVEFHEVALDNPLSARLLYRGELAGRIFWFDVNSECWREVAYRNHERVNEEDCLGQ